MGRIEDKLGESITTNRRNAVYIAARIATESNDSVELQRGILLALIEIADKL